MPRQKPAGDYGRYRFDETRRAPGRSDGNISRLEAKTRRRISSTSTHHTKALRKRETDVIAMASTTTSSLARYAQ